MKPINDVFTTELQQYATHAASLTGLMLLLIIAGLLIRAAWMKRSDTTGVSYVYAVFGALTFVVTGILLFELHLDLYKGVVGLFIGAGLIFGKRGRRRAPRRARF